ncbi:MAG: TRAP transporter large permease [Deltaproteobacteria bacterium]|nr:MAG: TRAP transporter large permease [Deltaproteobacteria bacterium]
MSPLIVGCIGFLFLMFLMSMGMPIAFAFMASGLLGITYLSGIKAALFAFGHISYHWSTVYVFICVPLFIFMGFMFSRCGVARELYMVANKWVGRLPGGLGLATVGGCGLFAAVTGSSAAQAASMSAIVYPEMRRYNYDKRLAVGAIAAGGTIGIMIPPSVGFIIYSLMTEASIGELFMAGLIPGIREVILYSITIVILVKMRPDLAPLSPDPVPWKEKILSLKDVWPALITFLVVLGGIYLGVFTPVAAAGIGAAMAILITFTMRRLTWRILVECMLSSTRVTAMIFLLIMGAMVFNTFLAMSNLPQALSEILGGINSKALLIAIILIIYFPLGALMDTTSMFVLTVPLYLPTLIANDINLLWFGVLAVRCSEIGLISPPVGMNVYIVKGMVKDVSLEEAFEGVIPFLITDTFILALLALFPQLSLFIPNLMW